jgi:hypothetical protein
MRLLQNQQGSETVSLDLMGKTMSLTGFSESNFKTNRALKLI